MTQMASPMLLLDAKGDLRPYNSAASLLGALWLEFGQVASGVRKQIPCESCGQWMDVTNNRSHKRKHANCSLREKMARYRRGKGLTTVKDVFCNRKGSTDNGRDGRCRPRGDRQPWGKPNWTPDTKDWLASR